MQLREQPDPSAAHRGEDLSTFCPRFKYTIELIGRRWVGPIIRVLRSQPARFNEILAAVPGLSDRLLTERLRELEAEHLVTRSVSDGRPVRVSYELTDSGLSLMPIIREISDWSERWVDVKPESARA